MKIAVSVLALCAVSIVATPILAAGGGGGGGGLPASSGPRVDPAEAYQQGVEALQAKDYKVAEKRFGDVLSVAPKNPEANYYMALAKVGLEKPKQSVRYLQRAIKERPNFVEAREKLALVSIGLDDADEARAQLAAIEAIKAECLADDAACDDPFKARADSAAMKVSEALRPKVGETPEAMVSGDAPAADEPTAEDAAGDAGGANDSEGQQSLFFAPRGTGEARYVAAVRLINEARYEEAIASLYAAQTAVGPHPDILNYLGYAHRKLARFDAAQSYYAQALAIAPDHLGANEYLGELYLELGDRDRARRQLATLDRLCAFGCAEREDLARLIALKASDRQASR